MNHAVGHTPSRPDPALRPTDALGCAFLGWAAVATARGWWLATRASIVPWAAGQTILAAAFLQWFALLPTPAPPFADRSWIPLGWTTAAGTCGTRRIMGTWSLPAHSGIRVTGKAQILKT